MGLAAAQGAPCWTAVRYRLVENGVFAQNLLKDVCKEQDVPQPTRKNRMSLTVRWGILGTGVIAQKMAEALATIPDARLLAVASRSLDKAQAFAEKNAIPHAFGSYQRLANDADIDVVYVATPHSDHCQSTLLCLNAGRAVLCEKPFAINARETASMIAAARSQGVFLMEALWTRFIPAVVEARRLIDAGAIGTPTGFHCDFGFPSAVDDEHRLVNPALGGGALLDLGIYPISMAAYFLGPIVKTQAMAQLSSSGVDMETLANLQHQDGGLSTTMCTLRASGSFTATINGSKARLRLENPCHHTQRLTLSAFGQPDEIIDMPYVGNGYQFEAMHVNAALLAGKTESDVVPLDETLHLMQILDQVRAQIGVRYPGE